MPVGTAEVGVLIVGGGLVGLTARALLARWGVHSLLVEKRGELSPFPRSRLINVRSMEIFRQLGLAAEIEARAFGPEYGRIRFRDTMLDADFAVAEMVGVNAPIPESPVTGVVSSQDRLEPVLLAAAEAEVRLGVELVGLSEESARVVATLVDHESGETYRVLAHYVIASDGAGSTVRDLLGVGTTGPGTMANFTTVVFDAALDRWCADRPAGVYFAARGSFGPLYPEGGWAWFVQTQEEAHRADWRELLLRALGHADLEVTVRRASSSVPGTTSSPRSSTPRRCDQSRTAETASCGRVTRSTYAAGPTALCAPRSLSTASTPGRAASSVASTAPVVANSIRPAPSSRPISPRGVSSAWIRPSSMIAMRSASSSASSM